MKDNPYYYIKKIDFLIVKYLDLFRQYFGYNYEDISQELTVAYLKAKRTYDPNKGTKFETYVINCLKNYLFDMYRATTRKMRGRIAFVESEIQDTTSRVPKRDTDAFIEATQPIDNPEERLIELEDLAIKASKLNEEELAVYTMLSHTGGDSKKVCEYLCLDKKNYNRIFEAIVKKLHTDEAT